MFVHLITRFLLLLVNCLDFSFLFTLPLFFPLRIAPLRFQAGCRRRWLNLVFSLSWLIFCCYIFVFYELYFVDLVSIALDLC